MAVSTGRYLKQIPKSVCRPPFWTVVSEILACKYCDLFKQWESIAPEMQKKIWSIHMDRIDANNGDDQEDVAATQCNPEMIIDDEEV